MRLIFTFSLCLRREKVFSPFRLPAVQPPVLPARATERVKVNCIGEPSSSLSLLSLRLPVVPLAPSPQVVPASLPRSQLSFSPINKGLTAHILGISC